MKIVTVFGAGLLVGTALAVIIPEGIRALYSDAIEKMHSHQVADKLTAGTVTPETHADDDVEFSSTIGLSLVLGESKWLFFFCLLFSARKLIIFTYRYVNKTVACHTHF